MSTIRQFVVTRETGKSDYRGGEMRRVHTNRTSDEKRRTSREISHEILKSTPHNMPRESLKTLCIHHLIERYYNHCAFNTIEATPTADMLAKGVVF